MQSESTFQTPVLPWLLPRDHELLDFVLFDLMGEINRTHDDDW